MKRKKMKSTQMVLKLNTGSSRKERIKMGTKQEGRSQILLKD